MKALLTLVFLAATLSTVNSYANTSFSVTSKERGISAFDFTVTEIHRSERYSTLSIPKFQSRSAAASRWMMCVYAELAIARGFE